MRGIQRSAILLLVLAGCAAGPTTKLTLREFNEHYEIIGRLGLPLGTVTMIEATIVDGDSLGTKPYGDTYLLRVTRVSQNTLASPPVMRFTARYCDLPNERSERYQQLYGDEPRVGTGGAVRSALDSNYVGRSYTLLAYEVGVFQGTPDNLPTRYTWQDYGWFFHTSLVVIDVNPTACPSPEDSPEDE